MFHLFHSSLRQLPDEALMQQIARRNERAFAELYERYGRRMHRYFYRMLWRDAALAEDFTQELFLKIIEKPQAYDPARPFRPWIYTLAANLCKNEYRRKKPAGSDTPAPEMPEPEGFYLPDRLDRELFENSLRDAIDQLGALHQHCFVLRYQEELSIADIAQILDCPEGTVKSRLHYALQKVTDRMFIFKH